MLCKLFYEWVRKKILFSTGICYNICIEIIDKGQPYDACDTTKW